jgi:hypothetical protein
MSSAGNLLDEKRIPSSKPLPSNAVDRMSPSEVWFIGAARQTSALVQRRSSFVTTKVILKADKEGSGV